MYSKGRHRLHSASTSRAQPVEFERRISASSRGSSVAAFQALSVRIWQLCCCVPARIPLRSDTIATRLSTDTSAKQANSKEERQNAAVSWQQSGNGAHPFVEENVGIAADELSLIGRSLCSSGACRGLCASDRARWAAAAAARAVLLALGLCLLVLPWQCAARPHGLHAPTNHSQRWAAGHGGRSSSASTKAAMNRERQETERV